MKQNLPAHNPAWETHKAGDRHCRDTLARATLPDEPQCLALCDTERDAIHRLDDALFGEEMGLEVFNFQNVAQSVRASRCSPCTRRRASEISPTVAYASTA